VGSAVLASALGALMPGVSALAASVALPTTASGERELESLEGLSDAEIALRLAEDPASLGPLSIGRPNRGRLFNPRRMDSGPFWEIVTKEHAFATDDTIASIARAISRVNEVFPGSPRLHVGDLSGPRGGYLRPHHSHQSGRDVDLGYYYLGDAGWYSRATPKTLDRARTWELVKAFAEDPNVETIFMDRSVQRLLHDHAERAGESRALLERVFRKHPHGDGKFLYHQWGHLTHLHVRFASARACEAGERARPELEAAGILAPTPVRGRGARVSHALARARTRQSAR